MLILLYSCNEASPPEETALVQTEAEVRANNPNVERVIIDVENLLNKKYARMGGQFYGSEVIKTKKTISFNLKSFNNKDINLELEKKITTKLKNAMFCSKFKQKSIGLIDVEVGEIKNNLVKVDVSINVLERSKGNIREVNNSGSRSYYITYGAGSIHDAHDSAPSSLNYVVQNNVHYNAYGTTSVYFTNIITRSWTEPWINGALWKFSCGGPNSGPCVPTYFDINDNPTPAYLSLVELNHNEMNAYRGGLEGAVSSQTFGSKKFASMGLAATYTPCSNCKFETWYGNIYFGDPNPINADPEPEPTDPEPCDCENY
jgi:hypothetical protein